MTDSFGARLRAERERKRIALKAIAQSTKISVALLQALERDDASRWPSGIFRRAFIRAYAEAIGLDPGPIVREFLERFPDPASEGVPEIAKDGRRRAVRLDPSAADSSVLRLTLAEERSRFVWPFGTTRSEWPRRLTAAACDLALVVAIASIVFAFGGPFWTPLTIVTVCYYFGGIVALGNSPGACLVGRSRNAVAVDPDVKRIEPQDMPAQLDETDNLRRFKPRPVVPPELARIVAPVNIVPPTLENTDKRHASI